MILEPSGGSKLIEPSFIFKKIGLKEKMFVADLGCGAVGHFVFPASRIVGKEGRVYAVDIQKQVLENIEKRADLENLHNITAVWSDLERYGAAQITSETLDFSLVINTLFQIKDRVTALKEAIRLVKVSGRVVIIDWLSVSVPFGPPIEGRVDPAWAEEAMDNLGMKLIDRFSAGQYHFGLVFEK